MTQQQASVLPQKVDLAVKLLYGVVALGIVRAVINAINHIDVRSIGLMHLGHAFVFAVSGYLIYQISKQQNWARIAVLVILIVDIPLTVLPMLDSLKHSPLNNGLGLVQAGVFIAAMVLLYRPESSLWFDSEQVGEG